MAYFYFQDIAETCLLIRSGETVSIVLMCKNSRKGLK